MAKGIFGGSGIADETPALFNGHKISAYLLRAEINPQSVLGHAMEMVSVNSEGRPANSYYKELFNYPIKQVGAREMSKETFIGEVFAQMYSVSLLDPVWAERNIPKFYKLVEEIQNVQSQGKPTDHIIAGFGDCPEGRRAHLEFVASIGHRLGKPAQDHLPWHAPDKVEAGARTSQEHLRRDESGLEDVQNTIKQLQSFTIRKEVKKMDNMTIYMNGHIFLDGENTGVGVRQEADGTKVYWREDSPGGYEPINMPCSRYTLSSSKGKILFEADLRNTLRDYLPKPDLEASLATFMAENKNYYSVPIDRIRGQYCVPIVFANEHHAVQSLGRGNVVVHDVRRWDSKPTVGQQGTVRYENKKTSITWKEPYHDRGKDVGHG